MPIQVLTDEQWRALEPLLNEVRPWAARPIRALRRTIEAIVWPEFAVCGQRLEITPSIQDVTKGALEACAYRRPGSGRDGVPAAFRLGLAIKGLFGSARDQALVLRDQEMGSINSPAEGRAGDRSAPCTHG